MNRTVGAVVASAVLLAACGGSYVKATQTKKAQATQAPETTRATVRTTPTTTKATDYAAQYLADANPANASLAKGASEATAWANAGSPAAKLPAIVDPLVSALHAFDAKLTAQTWPANARADVHTLIVASATVAAQWAALAAGGSAMGDLVIEAQLAKSEPALNAAANVVRLDLGLPPS